MTTTDKIVGLIPIVIAADIAKKAGKGLIDGDDEEEGVFNSRNTKIN